VVILEAEFSLTPSFNLLPKAGSGAEADAVGSQVQALVMPPSRVTGNYVSGDTRFVRTLRIPVQTDHRFRSKSITDSGANRSPIPEQIDRLNLGA